MKEEKMPSYGKSNKYMQKYSIVKTRTKTETVQLTRSSVVNDVLREIWEEDMSVRESFYVLYLNRRNVIVGYSLLSLGGISETTVDIRLLMKPAIDSLACSIVLAHNHPSGNLQPSVSDRQVTNRIKDACKIFSIELLDHLILTEDGYCSFADEGIM